MSLNTASDKVYVVFYFIFITCQTQEYTMMLTITPFPKKQISHGIN